MIFSVGLTILLLTQQSSFGLDCWVCHLKLNGNPNACYDNHQGILEKCNFTNPLCVMKKKTIGFFSKTVTNWRYCTEKKEHHVFNCRDWGNRMVS
jgi:hypothetical protein